MPPRYHWRFQILRIGRELAGNRAEIVNQYRLVAFPHAERVRADWTGSKGLPTDDGERLMRSAFSQAGQTNWDQQGKAEQPETSFHGFNKESLPNRCSVHQKLLRLECGEFTQRAGAGGFET
jgi:hypothetical protein